MLQPFRTLHKIRFPTMLRHFNRIEVQTAIEAPQKVMVSIDRSIEPLAFRAFKAQFAGGLPAGYLQRLEQLSNRDQVAQSMELVGCESACHLTEPPLNVADLAAFLKIPPLSGL